MKQFFENIFCLKAKINNLFHNEISDSYNKTEYHFHGPVNFIGKPSRLPKRNINSLTSNLKKDNKF